MGDEKRMIDTYEVMHSIYVGKLEVVLGYDPKQNDPYMVCCCNYNNMFRYPMPERAVVSDDYFEAMETFIERLKDQMQQARAECEKFGGDKEPFAADDCILYGRNESIIDKVVVLDVSKNRPEYQHPAYQLILAEDGFGATGGRGEGVFGTCLATGEKAKWRRSEVIGEIRAEKMPEWAKEKLTEIKRQKEERKKEREAR